MDEQNKNNQNKSRIHTRALTPRAEHVMTAESFDGHKMKGKIMILFYQRENVQGNERVR